MLGGLLGPSLGKEPAGKCLVLSPWVRVVGSSGPFAGEVIGVRCNVYWIAVKDGSIGGPVLGHVTSLVGKEPVPEKGG